MSRTHGAARADVEALIEAARRTFLSGERVEMRALAAELGVGRSTLYRWVGDREQLLGEVLWRLAASALEQAAAEVDGSGPDRVVRIAAHYVRSLHGFGPLHQFLTSEPETAIRVLTTSRADVQKRTVRWFADLIATERAAVSLAEEVDETVLAYALVRIGESFLYADAIAGMEPNVDQAIAIMRAILRP
jgi:AcrR family transcriptional regulator